MTDLKNPWDTLMKLLLRHKIQVLASLLLPGIVVGEALDKELKIQQMVGDFFFNAILDGIAIILHVEFQKSKDVRMGRRMWEYNVAMDLIENKPVYSILIYLAPDGNDDTFAGSPYVREVPGTGMGHCFTFQVIKLWLVEPEEFKQPGYEDLLPLLPLTKGGKSREVVGDMMDELVTRKRSDLLRLGYHFAGLVLTDPQDQHWLTERFRKVLMNLDILKESWTYQETVAEILEQHHAEIEQHRAEVLEEIEQCREEIEQRREEIEQRREEIEQRREEIEQRREEIEQRREEIERHRAEALAEVEQRREEILAEGCEEGIGQGLARGRLQALHQAVISVVKARFPELERPAKLIIVTISDMDRLQALIGDFSALASLQEAQQLLLSLA
jgi:hypothetical protein